MATRSAIVTGGGTGIGAAIARRLSADGYAVTVMGRRAEPLDEVVQTHPLFPGLDGVMERELARFEAEHPLNMALTSPATTEADVDLHSSVFEEAARDLVAGR